MSNVKSDKISNLSGKSHSINNRKSIGFFSLDENDECKFDLSQLKYLVQPLNMRHNFYLRDGQKRYEKEHKQKKQNTQEDYKLNSLLNWISNNMEKVYRKNSDGEWISPDFISYRGILTKFFNSRNQTYWKIVAARMGKSIFICEFPTKEKLKSENNRWQQIRSYEGNKFEKYLMSNSPNGKPNPCEPINEHGKFYIVTEAQLNNYKLLYIGEMDGVESKTKIENVIDNDIKFVELKTYKTLDNDRIKSEFYGRRLKQIWPQSYLVGIRDIIFGFCTQSGYLCDVMSYKLQDIEKLGEEYWNTDELKMNCDKILNFIKQEVKEDYDKCLYKFEVKLDNIEVEKFHPTDYESKYVFLDENFIEKVKHYKQNIPQ